MMRTNYSFFGLMLSIVFMANYTFAQSINFDETWKEFLENDKISNMSELIRPDKEHDQLDYAKYLLMNTNTCFCQSKIKNAEKLMAEIREIKPDVKKSVPGFVLKMEDLETKIKAYHSIDKIWEQFLQTKEVNLAELEDIKTAKTVCEKGTLAKYSFMTAHANLCQGNISKAKDILENRTLKLTEKTTLEVDDIEGLATEVGKMKTLFQDMATLETVWNKYVETGVSNGFDLELPFFRCYPIPNMKVLVLRGAVDVCNLAPLMLEEMKKLQTETGVEPDGKLKIKIKELQAAIKQNDTNLEVLNKTWEAFIPDNKVQGVRQYGYEYCTKEPLIRAYIMDGFTNVCGMATEVLEKIEALQRKELTPLEEITMIKINELAEYNEKFQTDQSGIEQLWKKFISQGDTLLENYQLSEFYCDNVHQVKSWVIQGLANSCEQSHPYLEQIEELQQTFDFKFEEEVECRVQKLRIKVWECRYKALLKLARLETSPDTYQERLEELMTEYGMGARPEECILDE